MKIVHTDSTNDFWVHDFKDTYASLFEQYKKQELKCLEIIKFNYQHLHGWESTVYVTD